MAPEIAADVFGYAWKFICNTSTCCALILALLMLGVTRVLIRYTSHENRRESDG